MFRKADEKGCTVAKLITGKDMPLTNLEMTLYGTYDIATRRFEQAHKPKRR